MRIAVTILFVLITGWQSMAFAADNLQFDFYGQQLHMPLDDNISVPFSDIPTQTTVQAFYDKLNAANYQPIVQSLLAFKEQHQLNDWFFYQLIRKTAQQLSPKAENYHRYTLYKWFLLGKSGYDAQLAISNQRLIFYVRSDDNIYDIPYYMQDGKQYVCLNIHDYININLQKEPIFASNVQIPEGSKAFSYKVTQMPEFTPTVYEEKELRFNYDNKNYHFKLKLNPDVQRIFVNYPVVDYKDYFNIPLSSETYTSLIPILKENVKSMKQKKGVDYLMRFTRHAFLYEDDQQSFGKEKRFSPEQTLLNQYSDCDDRAGLFFYLVKELYDLPMIVLMYPTHVTIAVKFDKPTPGDAITYNGQRYTICEPTPQSEDLRIGQLSSEFRKQAYEVVYAYTPQTK